MAASDQHWIILPTDDGASSAGSCDPVGNGAAVTRSLCAGNLVRHTATLGQNVSFHTALWPSLGQELR